jgi:hypothetical protein
MRIDSSGNVGIGTVTPGQKLDVAGTVNAQGIQTSGTPSLGFGASKWMVQQETNAQSLSYYCGPDASTYGTHFLYRATSTGTPQIVMTYSPAGNVGVGTTSPVNKLDVVGDNARSVARAGTSAGQSLVEAQVFDYWSGPTYTGVSLRQSGSTTTGTTAGLSNANLGTVTFQNGSAALIQTNGTTPIVFAIANIERMRIDGSGNVGIGANSPATTLQVNATTSMASSGSVVDVLSLTDNDGVTNGVSGARIGLTISAQSNISDRRIGIYAASVAPNYNTPDIAFWASAQGVAYREIARFGAASGKPSFINGSIALASNATTIFTAAGSVVNNTTISVTISTVEATACLVVAMHNHYGLMAGYGCARMSMLSNGNGGMQEINVSNSTSGNGGAWSFAYASATTFTITKSAGSYIGGGYYTILVIGNYISN